MSSADPAAAAREVQQRVQEENNRLQRASQEQLQQIQRNLKQLEQFRQQQMQQMRQQQQVQQAAAARDQQLRYHRGLQEQQERMRRVAPLAPPMVQSTFKPEQFENKRVSDLRLQNMRDLREQYQAKAQVAPEQMPQRADMPWQDFALQKEQAFRDRQADLQKQINEQPNTEARQRLELVKAHEYHNHKDEQLGNAMAFQDVCNGLTNQPDGQKEQMAQWKAEREAHQEQAAASLEKLQELDRKQEAGRTTTAQGDHAQVPTRQNELEKEQGFGQSQQQGQTTEPGKEAINTTQAEKSVAAELSYADKIAQQRQQAAKNPSGSQNENDVSARDEIHGHRQSLDRVVSEERVQSPSRQSERDKDHEQAYAR